MIPTALLKKVRDYQLIWAVLENGLPKCIVDVTGRTTYWSDNAKV
jgi:hypothetical protein